MEPAGLDSNGRSTLRAGYVFSVQVIQPKGKEDTKKNDRKADLVVKPKEIVVNSSFILFLEPGLKVVDQRNLYGHLFFSWPTPSCGRVVCCSCVVILIPGENYQPVFYCSPL